MDLSLEGTKCLTTSSVWKVGAPTRFLVILVIHSMGGIERKWKMCCRDAEQQRKWWEALRTFDGPPKKINIGDDIMSFLSTPMYATHTTTIEKSGSMGGNIGSPNSRRISDAIIGSFQKVHRSMSVSNIDALKEREKDRLRGKNYRSKTELWGMVAGVNCLFLAGRIVDVDGFWVCFLVVNILLVRITNTEVKGEETMQDRFQREKREEEERERARTTASKSEAVPFVPTTPAGSTFERAHPLPDSECEKVFKEFGGATTARGARICAQFPGNGNYKTMPHSYWNGDAKIFKVRMGPNYKKTGRKEASLDSLFDLYSVDLVRSDARIKESGGVFKMPDIPGITDEPTGHPSVPPMFVVNCGIPSEEPSVFGSSDDGVSFISIFYFVISEETKRQLKDLDNASPAVKLFAEWCRRAEDEAAFRGRFKAMCILDDIKNLGLPSFISNYNGKPVLINKSGTFYRRKNYIEMNINVHIFAFIARKALYSLQPKFPKMVLNVGFVIEGRDDSELPECMFGSARLMHMDPGKAPDDLHDGGEEEERGSNA